MFRALATGFFGLGLISSFALAAEMADKADEKPADVLKVVVTPSKTAVAPNKPFKVSLVVENASSQAQTLEVMSCSWDGHWQSDNRSVAWNGWPCFKNIRQQVTLEPGKSYAKELEMHVAADAPKGKISFRMGFTPIDSTKTYWSEPVKLSVESGE